MLIVSAPSWSGIATYPPGATFGPRQMRDYELVWMIEGNARYTWNGIVVDAPQGSVVLCRPGGTDLFEWDRDRNTRHGFVHFLAEQLPEEWPAEQAWPFVRRFDDSDIVPHVFRHMLTWSQQGDPSLVRAAIAHLLAVFVTGQANAVDVSAGALPQPVERVMQYIYRRLDDDAAAAIPFESLVEAGCVTGPHLCRLFKRTTGRTPAETVRLARLDRAHELVVRSNFSVKEIAQMTGFASAFHFSRLYAKAFNVAPALLRRQLKTGVTPPLPRLLRHGIYR